MERKPFIITLDGRDIEVTENNHGVAMFRDDPQYDYIDLREKSEGSDEEMHHLIFRHRWLCLWMGRVATMEDDFALIEALEEENGTFRDMAGFNSNVFIEDKPSDAEKEYYTQGLLTDLGDLPPEGWE